MNRRSFTKVLGLIAAAPKLVRPQEPVSPVVPDAWDDHERHLEVAESSFGHRVQDVDLGKMTEPERREFFRIIERQAKDQVFMARTYHREYVEGERNAAD